MKRYTFSQGNWEMVNPLPEQGDNEQYDDYLVRIDYGTVEARFGHPDGAHMEVYEANRGDSFLASICPNGGTIYEVYLPDFPSYMMLVRDLAPAFATNAGATLLEETLNLQQKFFQLHHGHDAYTICPECDPQEWERRLQQRQARSKAK